MPELPPRMILVFLAVFAHPLLAGPDDAKTKQAVTAIEKVGGSVEFRKEKEKSKVVVSLLALPPKVTEDAALAPLADLGEVHQLSLGNDYSDAGLARIKGLKTLEYLSCNGDKFTDAGLVHLKGLSELKTLNLGGARHITG